MGYVKDNPLAQVIAVDFDGTLSTGHYPNCGTPNIPLFKALIKAQSKGHKIVLWTCREDDSYLQEAVDFCKNYGLTFDAVNENIPDIDFKSRKIAANIYIDDLSCGVNRGIKFLDYLTED